MLGPFLVLLSAALAAPGAPAGLDWVALPGGVFPQGDPALPDAPPREVRLTAFEMLRHEVTIDQFAAFVAADPATWSPAGTAWRAAHPDGAGADHRAAGRPGDHPVVAVTAHEAAAFCAWVGGRLPTEAEWEYAACGTAPRRFPWGDDEAVAARWYAGGKFGALEAVETAPVTEEDPACGGPFGLVHMAGNVWEWTADAYQAAGWTTAPATDPAGPAAAGPWRVLRGGSWMNLPSYATCHHREPARPDRVAYTVGFRCVRGGGQP